MAKNPFGPPHSWIRFSRKLAQKIENPRFIGSFSSEDALQRNMRLAIGEAFVLDGMRLKIYLLVDEWDGVIADARFQAFGPPALLGAVEGCCEMLLRKNYDQAGKITADLLDFHLRDKKDKEAFPVQEYRSLNLVLEALEIALSHCTDIPLPESYVPTPVKPDLEGGPYPGWEELTAVQQRAVIESVIAQEIRPYIELDAGGIEIVSFNGKELLIGYKGACATCPSSIGSTLQAIQQILSAKVHPDIKVIPDSSFLMH